MWWRRSSVFRDPPVELTEWQLRRGLDAARRAARASQRSLTSTKARQYRRYRAEAGEHYLDWPRWKAEYLREYNRRINIGNPPSGSYISG
ncbi:hypothetical protein [Nocardia blacklockiae]|uniref:hypothetical protein n=1 Tax=Nocardia blacklockiae TaxID=480036 RepID=UPI001895170B|nr:hypothetical protein [Nocardia blacklockiae]MBF6172066.1 hypothetical protein [Nocardia blacklockiae]